METKTICGDCTIELPKLATGSVQSVITSPPYFLQRDYKVAPTAWPEVSYAPIIGVPEITVPAWSGCLGLEPTPLMYVAHLVYVFRLVRPVLADTGNVWLNLGDKYASDTKHGGATGGKHRKSLHGQDNGMREKIITGVGDKQLMLLPHRLGLALQADGWYLRNHIVWHKTNAQPEKVEDRLTRADESILLLAKSKYYYFDYQAIREPARNWGRPKRKGGGKYTTLSVVQGLPPQALGNSDYSQTGRHKRNVWSIPTTQSNLEHTAVMPEALVEPCVLAGSAPGDTILDPFAGAGTVQKVATCLGRNSISIEINPDFQGLILERNEGVQMEMLGVAV